MILANGKYSFDTLSGLTINELNVILNSKNKTVKDTNTNGTADIPNEVGKVTVTVTQVEDSSIIKTFTVDVINNGVDLSQVVSDLPAGNYTVVVAYAGNENFTSCENASVGFEVALAPTVVNVAVEGIVYGNNATVWFNITNTNGTNTRKKKPN